VNGIITAAHYGKMTTAEFRRLADIEDRGVNARELSAITVTQEHARPIGAGFAMIA
jgi:hypothetical protein